VSKPKGVENQVAFDQLGFRLKPFKEPSPVQYFTRARKKAHPRDVTGWERCKKTVSLTISYERNICLAKFGEGKRRRVPGEVTSQSLMKKRTLRIMRNDIYC
jgi:hypothetical protein